MNQSKIKSFVLKQYVWMCVLAFLTVWVQYKMFSVINSYYLNSGGSGALAYIGAALALLVVGGYYTFSYAMLRKTVDDHQTDPRWAETRAKVYPILEEICNKQGLVMPTLGFLAGTGKDIGSLLEALSEGEIRKKLLSFNAALGDIPMAADVVLIGSELPGLLSSEELGAVLAHETRHSNQPENKFRLVVSFGSTLLSMTFALASIHLLFKNGFTDYQTWFAILAGASVVRIGGSIINLLKAAFSRRVEYKTDALACQDLGSPEALIAGLTKIEKARDEALPGYQLPPAILWDHPSTQSRARVLRAMVA